MTLHHPANTDLFHVQSIYPVDPGAGAQYSAALTDLGRQQLIAVAFMFQAAVAVADRYLTIRITTAARTICRAVHAAPITSGQLAYAYFATGLTPAEALSGTDRIINAPLPDHLILTAPNTFTIHVENINAGDQLSNIYLWYNHWHQSTFT